MAVQKKLEKKSLILSLKDMGSSTEKFKNNTIANIKENATDENIFRVGNIFAELSTAELDSINVRTTESLSE